MGSSVPSALSKAAHAPAPEHHQPLSRRVQLTLGALRGNATGGQCYLGSGLFHGRYLASPDPLSRGAEHVLGQAHQLQVETQALLGAEHLDKRLGHLGENIDACGLIIPRHQVALQGRHARALLALASELNELTQMDRDLRATKTLQRS